MTSPLIAVSRTRPTTIELKEARAGKKKEAERHEQAAQIASKAVNGAKENDVGTKCSLSQKDAGASQTEAKKPAAAPKKKSYGVTSFPPPSGRQPLPAKRKVSQEPAGARKR